MGLIHARPEGRPDGTETCDRLEEFHLTLRLDWIMKVPSLADGNLYLLSPYILLINSVMS